MAERSIIFVAYSFTAGRGGIETFSRMAAQALVGWAKRQRWNVTLLATRDQTSHKFGPATSIALRGSEIALLRELRRSGRDSRVLYGHINLARASLVVPRRHAIVIFGIEVWESPSVVVRAAVRRADELWAISDYTRLRAERIWAGYGRAKVCWLGTEENAPGERSTEPTQNVLMVGRLVPGRDKGHRAVLDAWELVKARVPGAQLHIVGVGPDLEAIGARGRVERNVHVHGFVEQSELDNLWAQARVFAMPSRGEGFGLVYVDAMRRGVPIVASRCDAAGEVIGGTGAGILVDPDDRQMLGDAIGDLLADADCWTRASAAASQRWSESFTYDAFAIRFAELLDDWMGDFE